MYLFHFLFSSAGHVDVDELSKAAITNILDVSLSVVTKGNDISTLEEQFYFLTCHISTPRLTDGCVFVCSRYVRHKALAWWIFCQGTSLGNVLL